MWFFLQDQTAQIMYKYDIIALSSCGAFRCLTTSLSLGLDYR